MELAKLTWQSFSKVMGWTSASMNKTITHQVGGPQTTALLTACGVGSDKDFLTYEFLGNIGTVSLPLTAAIADERGFLEKGDKVGFIGIGSGLNCMMLGLSGDGRLEGVSTRSSAAASISAAAPCTISTRARARPC